jgi:hypothetical protein
LRNVQYSGAFSRCVDICAQMNSNDTGFAKSLLTCQRERWYNVCK